MTQDILIKSPKLVIPDGLKNFWGALLSEIAGQKDRVFLWLPVFFGFGIAAYFALKAEPPAWPSLIALALGSTLTLFFWNLREHWFPARYLALCLTGFVLMAAGFSAAQLRTALVHTPMLGDAIGPVDVEGEIVTIEDQGEGQGSRIVLKELVIEDLAPDHTPSNIRLKLRKDEGFTAGDRISALARINPPSPPVTPRAFDFQRYAYFKGLGGVGFIYNQPTLLSQKTHAGFFEKLRAGIIAQIEDHISYPTASVVITLMTGERGTITDEDKQAMRDSGLAHLLAISGLHVGMVAGVLFFFSRLLMAAVPALALHHPIKKYAALIALIGAFFYMLTVGATIPTQRAMMMTGLVLVAIMMDRSPFSLRLVALAAMVILIISPESLMSVSFQMSFAAVVALICFYEWIRPVWSSFHRRAGIMRRAALYLTGVCLTTVIAGFATGLFSLYHFQTFAVFGVIANLVAVPLMAFIVMPMAVLSYLLMPFGLDGLSLSIMNWGVEWVLATAHWTADLDGAVFRVRAWPGLPFAIAALSALSFLIWKGRGKYLTACIFILSFIPIMLHKAPDLQVSSDFDLVSVRAPENGLLWLSTGMRDRYAAENWLRLNGQSEDDKRIWPKEGGAPGFPMTCGAYGCRGTAKGQNIAVARKPQAIAEDCAWADIVLSPHPVEQACAASIVIDRFDVWREGAYALWLGPSPHIENVAETRGTRPWTE